MWGRRVGGVPEGAKMGPFYRFTSYSRPPSSPARPSFHPNFLLPSPARPYPFHPKPPSPSLAPQLGRPITKAVFGKLVTRFSGGLQLSDKVLAHSIPYPKPYPKPSHRYPFES